MHGSDCVKQLMRRVKLGRRGDGELAIVCDQGGEAQRDCARDTRTKRLKWHLLQSKKTSAALILSSTKAPASDRKTEAQALIMV